MTCPICDKTTVPAYRPFCSKRCADIDLSKWLSGSYAIPSDDPDDIEEALEAVLKASDSPEKPH